MKTRSIIGQKVVRVEQSVIERGRGHTPCNAVHWIELENGIRLIPLVHEGDSDYSVDFAVNKVSMKRRRKSP